MSTTINVIPNDIIFNIIVLNLDFSDVSKLALSSRYYNNNKETIYNTIIKNDKFLKDININILKTIEESSFSLKLFFELYDNIKNDKTINLSIPFINVRNRELTKERIDATIKFIKDKNNLQPVSAISRNNDSTILHATLHNENYYVMN